VKGIRGLRPTLSLPALALLVVAAPAAPTSAVGEMDIGALMARAEETLDLDVTDVALLFDGRDVRVASDGAVTTTFHQIVWISTELGIDGYADLRIPWNTTNATLEVEALRTWMDGRWWPHETNLNPTAIVETVPYAVARADDYTTMRETMLLHDGVELPCVMETVYTVTRRYPAGVGAEDTWLFARPDPAVVVRYAVTVAPDVPFSFAVGGGAPEPEVERGDDAHSYVWEMRDQPRLGVPHVADATTHAPYASWSTWRNWDALGSTLTASFGGAGELTDSLRDTVLALTEHEPHAAARVEAIASFIAGATRHIGYDSAHWAFEPRRVERVHETAYGHRLDRAALAAALLRRIDGVDTVTPVFRTAGVAEVATDVPGTSRFGGIELLVEGSGVRGIYDPGSSSFHEGEPDPFDGRTVWVTGEGAPRVLPKAVDEGRRVASDRDAGGETRARFTVNITLDRDDEGEWTGVGLVKGTAALSFATQIVGIGSETERFCRGVADDAVGATEITSSNIAEISDARSVAGFAFDWDPGDPDERDRSALRFGFCGSGLERRLPGDVHLYNQSRTSPVRLVAPLSEALHLRVRLPEDEVVVLPSELEVENRVGRFSQTVERDGDWLVVRRRLSIESVTIHPEWWSDLRALLLAGEGAQVSTVLFE